MTTTKTSNRLINETSPYLLQHAYNPVDWYPWGEEAFEKSRNENKPIFLSIGYSTCHWCHVMERESFEDEEVALLLNEHFIPVKVDKEERPDIDGVYMQVCMAMNGNGGWPLTILMTPAQNPFFAGTYLPKRSRRHMTGLTELLEAVRRKWQEDDDLSHRAAEITKAVQANAEQTVKKEDDSEVLLETAYKGFASRFDSRNGGFGRAPKFPSPHNLLFLMEYDRVYEAPHALRMAEKTLEQMYRGGIFDHIGYGFSRYSTDDRWLAPHFEKMLDDNALLLMAYVRAYSATGQEFYKNVAEKIIEYVMRELTHPDGGFYSAQDADSDGVEGKFYLFEPEEIIECLGPQDGKAFNSAYDIAKPGNFEGKSIPNLLNSQTESADFEKHLPRLREYRQSRYALHKDDKVLASWNGLMISALAQAHMAFGHPLESAKNACLFIEKHLMSGDTVFTSYRDGRRSAQGFLDDYAFMGLAMLSLYRATLEQNYLRKASALCEKAVRLFFDTEKGGFRISGEETLILDLKETYDGASPSGNSVMAYNMVTLSILGAFSGRETLNKHMDFMAKSAAGYPPGHCFFWLAQLLHNSPPKHITCVLAPDDDRETVLAELSSEPSETLITIHEKEQTSHPLLNGKTTYYVCENGQCGTGSRR